MSVGVVELDEAVLELAVLRTMHGEVASGRALFGACFLAEPGEWPPHYVLARVLKLSLDFLYLMTLVCEFVRDFLTVFFEV